MQSLMDQEVITFWLWPNWTVQFFLALFDLIWPSYSVAIETTQDVWGISQKQSPPPSSIPTATVLIWDDWIFIP